MHVYLGAFPNGSVWSLPAQNHSTYPSDNALPTQTNSPRLPVMPFTPLNHPNGLPSAYPGTSTSSEKTGFPWTKSSGVPLVGLVVVILGILFAKIIKRQIKTRHECRNTVRDSEYPDANSNLKDGLPLSASGRIGLSIGNNAILSNPQEITWPQKTSVKTKLKRCLRKIRPLFDMSGEFMALAPLPVISNPIGGLGDVAIPMNRIGRSIGELGEVATPTDRIGRSIRELDHVSARPPMKRIGDVDAQTNRKQLGTGKGCKSPSYRKPVFYGRCEGPGGSAVGLFDQDSESRPDTRHQSMEGASLEPLECAD
ncbi:hypothetical protein PCANC_21877 [Puccinia coronata f. sp. avenae]|uniref:Uncharacterized protein n=1 Tax=Puccinia coronata f. sp. avenae TaxID=200324 RepID=A0A2N5S6A5_9BASI|nr:hypothetical protein PCANC_21877 [Puccinia coronata f. sp. avenae]